MNNHHTTQVDFDDAPCIEDLQFGLVSSLALIGAASDRLRIAGWASTNPAINRRDQLLALRHAAFALDEIEQRVPLLRGELAAMIRFVDPESEMLEVPA